VLQQDGAAEAGAESILHGVQEQAKLSAANTGELLRQHAALQAAAAAAAEEVDALRRAKAEAAEQLAHAQAESQQLAAEAGRCCAAGPWREQRRDSAHAALAFLRMLVHCAQPSQSCFR